MVWGQRRLIFTYFFCNMISNEFLCPAIGMEELKMSSVAERFLRYVKIDTESVQDVEQFPSSEKQKDLARLLAAELEKMGAENVQMDEYGYVYASIPATVPTEGLPVLGFIAHMDTSSAVSGKDVKPRIVEEYDGNDIVLDAQGKYILSPKDSPELLAYKGQDLIVTDGSTLLGADDKAGIAEIMEMAAGLLAHPEIPHGTIKIAFTPDEEVGRGADFFDVMGFGADFAYTVDGGRLGELEYENFNAASLVLTVRGKSYHPGSSKGHMKNAILMAMEFQSMLPVFENPMYTEDREGFYHLDRINGGVDITQAEYILRDHDRAKFEEKKDRVRKICAYLNDKYGEDSFTAEIKDSYYNMREKIEPHFHLINNAVCAMKDLGIEPVIVPVRGGTDGARLSFMGLPCPNLCTGGHNAHGRFEFVCVQSMEKIVELLTNVAKRYADPAALQQ